MAAIWGSGAVMQIEMTHRGLAYDHGYAFAAIMGLGSAVFLLLFVVALKLGR